MTDLTRALYDLGRAVQARPAPIEVIEPYDPSFWPCSLPIEALPEPVVPTRPTLPKVHFVVACVATYFGLTSAELRRRDRCRRYAWPRQIAMYLARELTPCSYPQLGRLIGPDDGIGLDHTSVLFGYRKVAALRATQPALSTELVALATLIAQGDIGALRRSPAEIQKSYEIIANHGIERRSKREIMTQARSRELVHELCGASA